MVLLLILDLIAKRKGALFQKYWLRKAKKIEIHTIIERWVTFQNLTITSMRQNVLARQAAWCINSFDMLTYLLQNHSCFNRKSHIGWNFVLFDLAKRIEFITDHSSAGRAEDCRVAWLSLGPWFDSGWSEFLLFLYTSNYADKYSNFTMIVNTFELYLYLVLSE